MKKKSTILTNMGIVLMAISAISIFVRLPFGEKFVLEYFDLQFWTYMVVSVVNLYAGYRLYKRVKNAEVFAMITIGATFVITEIVSRIVTSEYGFGYTFMAMIVPATLIIFLSIGRTQVKAKK